MRRGAALLLTGVLILGPLVPLVVWAVSGSWRYPALVPDRLTTRGLELAASASVLDGLLTSLTIGLAVTALALVVGVPAGRALGCHAFRGRRLLQFLLLAPAIVPTLAVLLGTQVFFVRLGLVDSVQGVVLAQLVPTVPYVTLVMTAAFAGFDLAAEDQARMLGAGPLRAVLHVTLPALRGPIVVAGVFAFLISWSEYILTLLIGGGTVQTLPLLLFSYARGADLTEAAAVALLVVLPPVLALAALSRSSTTQQGSLLAAGRL